MNNKGHFGLEILSIIIILGIATFMITSKISHAFSDDPENLYKSEQALILLLAKNYGNDILDEVKEHNNTRTISVSDLITNGYLNPSNDDGEYLDPRNNTRTMNDLNIKIIYDEKKDEIETKFVE